MKTITNKPGVYKITCLGNGIFYIGSACNLSRRANEHFSKFRRNTHENKWMQRCYNKYSESKMIYEVVEVVENLDNLLTTEQYYIDTLGVIDPKIGFNHAPIAGNCRGVKHSEETRRKVSEAGKGRVISKEQRLKQSLATKGRPGKPISKETKDKMRQIKLNNPTRYWLGRNHSEETRKKISDVQIGRKASAETRAKMKKTWLENKAKGVKAFKSKPVIILDGNNKTIKIDNVAEFCRKKKFPYSYFCMFLFGRRIGKRYKGYRLKNLTK